AHGAKVNAIEPKRGQSALMWAVASRHLDAARALVAHGADVRARSTGGFTPLLFAAREGDIDVITFLLDHGASIKETSTDGYDPLLTATVRGHLPAVKFMLERGADPNASAAGFTPLHWAAGNWDTQLTGPNGIAADEGEWRTLNGLKGAEKLEL